MSLLPDWIRSMLAGGPKGVCYPHDPANISKDRTAARKIRTAKESATSGQPVDCLNCRYFIDHRTRRDQLQEDDWPDAMGYCAHPIHSHNEHRVYGGHWTHESSSCSMWRPSGTLDTDYYQTIIDAMGKDL